MRRSTGAVSDGMIDGMAMVKKTITLPEDLLTEAASFAGDSFSAYMTEALRSRLAADRLARFVAEDAAERGPIDETTVEAVRAELAALDR